MKLLTNTLFICALFCVCACPSSAQKSTRKTRKPSQPKAVCSAEEVPHGMVVVGYKHNYACTADRELLVKLPAESETVCANSPVPAGYLVRSVQGALACTGAGPNPLTNAMLIEREKAAAEGGCPNGSVKVGVSATLVRQCLGQPTTVDTKLRQGGNIEVWTYSVVDEPWVVIQIAEETVVAIDVNDTKRIKEKAREYIYRLYQRANP